MVYYSQDKGKENPKHQKGNLNDLHDLLQVERKQQRKRNQS